MVVAEGEDGAEGVAGQEVEQQPAQPTQLPPARAEPGQLRGVRRPEGEQDRSGEEVRAGLRRCQESRR